MQRNRASNYQKQLSSTMSATLIHGGGAVNSLSPDDEDDNDICPVCDGDCTCDNKPRPPPALIVTNGHGRSVSSSISTNSVHVPGMPSLKIKFTVPVSMQNKARLLAQAKKSRADGISTASNEIIGSGAVSTVGHSQHAASTSIVGHGYHPSQDLTKKRKGRVAKSTVDVRDPSKTAVADRQIHDNEANTLPQSQSHLPSQSPHAQKPGASKGPRSNTKGARQPRTNFKSSRPPQKSQTQGTIGKKVSGKKKKHALFGDKSASDHADQSTDGSDNDTESGHFPTFVAASDLSPSSASDSSDSCSDSSGFDSDSSLEAEEENYILTEQRRHDKARVRRELLGDDSHRRNVIHNNNWVIRPRKKSVGLSDVDMDGDSDDPTEDDEEDDDMGEEEEDEETDSQAPSVSYTGLATGWSEDEESSFDADIFFANLSETNSDDTSSGDELIDPPEPELDDAMTRSISGLQQSTDLEMTEGWDGQIVFTNGCGVGQGVLDLAFEATAAQLLASDTTSISQDSDVEMDDGDEGDHEEVDSVIGTSDGETTEEELVDANGLPTSRAMKLFRWPMSISSINPLSTVSPAVSPAPHNRRPVTAHHRNSPRPADILARKTFCDESDHGQSDSGEGSAPSPTRRISRGGIPIMGQFEQGNDNAQKTAILTGSNKDIPSPFPRLAHRRRRIGSSSGGSFSSMDIRGHTSRLTIFTPSSTLPPPSSSDELSLQPTPEPSLAEPIELDDVLDSSYLDSEPETPLETGTSGEGDFHQSLNRWDKVPVGTFRLTQESAASSNDIPSSPPGWTSEPAKTAASDVRSYSNVMKSSPLSTMLWHDKGSSAKTTPRKGRTVLISPVILPIRDGDRTPTRVPHHHEQPLHNNYQPPHKTRKESRRETKMMKRKIHGPVHHQHFHHHNHHPNMKSRSTGSAQRNNFFSSPTSVPPLNI